VCVRVCVLVCVRLCVFVCVCMCVCVHVCVLVCVYVCVCQGCVIWHIVFNAYFTVLNKLGDCKNCSFRLLWPFWQFPPQQRPFSELPMLFYNILITQYIGKELGKYWVILGRIGSILGQKSAYSNLLTNVIVLYA